MITNKIYQILLGKCIADILRKVLPRYRLENPFLPIIR